MMSEVKESIKEEAKTDTFSITPLLYYQKPEIGSTRRTDPKFSTPVQVAFPDGGFGIGVAVVRNEGGSEQTNQDGHAVIISGPEYSDSDKQEKLSLKCAFFVMTVVNVVITTLIFLRADTVDVTKVEVLNSETQSVFQRVSSERTSIQLINFAFILVTLAIGLLSAVFESALGLSAYCLSVVLNFLLSTAALPYFVFSFRYLFDLSQLYLALVLRSKLVYYFLPAHIHRN